MSSNSRPHVTSNPRIVFCTTCKGRTNHLELTLPKNISDNLNYPNCKFVVLDYNSQDHMNMYLLDNLKHYIDSGLLVVYSMLPREKDGYVFPFRMAHAKNLAHRLGILEGADILVNLDADNYTGMNFAEYVAQEFSSVPDTYLWTAKITGKRGICGRIAVRSDMFMKVGGYDEGYNVWSPDDKDFNARLARMGYAGRQIEEQYLDVICHNDKVRFKEYRHIEIGQGEEDFDPESVKNSIANFGSFGEGIVYKNFDFSRPIHLAPVPTRIFGIGLHKTATTSLHSALTTLGYDSAHWLTAHWAKAIWHEMTTLGRSKTLERHYALSDLPIPVLYEKLDQAYPGSKFILTVRDEDNWIDSVRRHWNPNFNKFRRSWDHDPFSHFIHKHIYGRRDFDFETFIARYRKHNVDVQEYFKSRPADLLVFDVDKRHGWTELCRFLKCPVPSVLYPWAYNAETAMMGEPDNGADE